MKKTSFKLTAGAIMILAYAYGSPPKATMVKPGLGKIYAAPKSYFLALQAAPTAGSTLGENYEIITDHTFQVGKGLIELPAIFKEGSLKAATGGASGSKMTSWTIEVPLPGLSKQYLELMDLGINEEWIILAQLGECGSAQYIQIGNACNPAELTAEYDSSTKESKGANRAKLTFVADSIAIMYSGAITIYP